MVIDRGYAKGRYRGSSRPSDKKMIHRVIRFFASHPQPTEMKKITKELSDHQGEKAKGFD